MKPQKGKRWFPLSSPNYTFASILSQSEQTTNRSSHRFSGLTHPIDMYSHMGGFEEIDRFLPLRVFSRNSCILLLRSRRLFSGRAQTTTLRIRRRSEPSPSPPKFHSYRCCLPDHSTRENKIALLQPVLAQRSRHALLSDHALRLLFAVFRGLGLLGTLEGSGGWCCIPRVRGSVRTWCGRVEEKRPRAVKDG